MNNNIEIFSIVIGILISYIFYILIETPDVIIDMTK